jgi:SAM-dependent methyltransferase
MIEATPSPIDFSDIEQARAWTADTVARRPQRPRFFDAFCASLEAHFDAPIRVAELGSGPGHLARAILSRCRVEGYHAVDLSPAMHALAREHLGDLANRVTFIEADFRSNDWALGLAGVDAVVTMQAAHELRHKNRLPALLDRLHATIRVGGLLLYCDHYADPAREENSTLFLTRDEQPLALERAGFAPVGLVYEEGGMALYRAARPRLAW